MDICRMDETTVPMMSSMSPTSSTASSASAMETGGAARTALIIDGSYAMIGARRLGGKIDYVKLRAALEEQASTQFGDCWFFDQNPSAQRLNPALTLQYNRLKFAPPDGPQFQVSLFPMKRYSCHCRRCGNQFTQNVQKGVDNGIATKILSLAYENICDRFILFAGDGDFYSSLSHVRNVLRKDIWVMGYRGTVSGDLQQLASRVIWMNTLWSRVNSIQHVNDHKHGRRDERQKKEGCCDEMRWFEDHQGEGFQLSNESTPPLDETQDVSGRQVVIAPCFNQAIRAKGRGRDGRLSRRGRGNGRGHTRSRSRDRLRCETFAVTNAVLGIDAAPSFQAGAATRKKYSRAEGKRGAGGKNGRKRKRSGTDKIGEKRSNWGGHGGKQADDLPLFTLSDISSDENNEKTLSLPVTLGSAIVAPDVTAQGRNSGVDEIINLASDTESE